MKRGSLKYACFVTSNRKMIIFTHRGLEPSHRNFFLESSFESFKSHLNRGFSIEFDVNFTRDEIIVWHDLTLTRLSNGVDRRKLESIKLEYLQKMVKNRENGRIAKFEEVLELIDSAPCAKGAIHLKSVHQTKKKIDLVLGKISKFNKILDRIFIFDLKPKWARYIKSKNSIIQLGVSVAHSYDIERYNKFTGGTLVSIEKAITYRKERLFEWAWLDEWDLLNRSGQKKLYRKGIIQALKREGYRIVLVSPELHATSPSLLGKESHDDASTEKRLFSRIKEIITLGSEGICTDYPEEVRELIKNENL